MPCSAMKYPENKKINVLCRCVGGILVYIFWWACDNILVKKRALRNFNEIVKHSDLNR